METLICTLCVTEKPVTEFYKNKKMPSGYANQCKECVKDRAKARQEILRQDPEWVEKEKERGREKYHRLGYVNNYVDPEAKKRIIAKYKSKFPEKIRCQKAVSKIKTEGEKHHWSYNLGFERDFIEITVMEHNLIHRFIKYDQERFMFRVIKPVGGFYVGELLDTKERHEVYINEIIKTELNKNV